MRFLANHQLGIMLFLSGMSGILAFLTLMTRALSERRKTILTTLAAAAMLLLLFDRYSYLYRGDPSTTGYVMVRVSNGMVYFLSLFIPHLVTRYLYDLFRHEGGMSKAPKRLILCQILFVLGTVLVIISQFTGLYYTFDATNTYQRAPGHFLCYLIPAMMVVLQESAILRYRTNLSRNLQLSLMASLALPLAAAVVQYFVYGLSLINMTAVLLSIVFFIYAMNDLSAQVERAKEQEVNFYKETQRREFALFVQTAQALVSAIDAKDAYTHGHSARVAQYARRIAQEAGHSEQDCEMVFFAALLHDVGKIGVSDEIINKVGPLTEAEFDQIKVHSILGSQILSGITQTPYLRLGARYHHEHYDGTGYPDGLAGEDIPEVARIIAVADAYDAMTSTRSYRGQLPQQTVRAELVHGIGTQFDPQFAQIMLRLVDEDKNYEMRELPGREAAPPALTKEEPRKR